MRNRLCVPIIVALAVLFANPSPAHAGLDNELSLLSRSDLTLTIQQWDTLLNGIDALDRNPLTREWFHSGRAIYRVTGASADQFTGRLVLGYEVSYPGALGGDLYFNYRTPNVRLDKANRLNRQIITPQLFPGVAVASDLANGPGVREVVTFSVEVSGPDGNVAVSNAHGMVTGAAGGVLLRPFARLISAPGESVTTYGEPWNMN